MRTITEGEAIRLLQTQFGLTAPVAFEDVKAVYRKKRSKMHPDTASTDREQEFKALSGAYRELKKLFQTDCSLFSADPTNEEEIASFPTHTVDGTPLHELGLGLGPTTNGRECENCNADGYKISREYKKAPCETCKGEGKVPRELPCRPCKGSGRFIQAQSRREVDCRVCGGSGIFKHPYQRMWCPSCLGAGTGSDDAVARTFALKCHVCKGAGETEIWNPVIPKGRLSFQK